MNEIITQDISHGDIAPIRQSAASKVLMPQSFDDVVRLADMMSNGSTMVGKVCHNNVGNCCAVIMQAARWGLDPFSISHECYVVSGNLAYGAKLVSAVIAANAPIQGRLSYEYSGAVDDRTRKVRVYATFRGESDPAEIITPQLSDIKPQNSPLWKSDPDQQLAYYGARAWARRHAPDIIMGIVSDDETRDMQSMRNVSDGNAKSRIQQRLGTAKPENLPAPETEETSRNTLSASSLTLQGDRAANRGIDDLTEFWTGLSKSEKKLLQERKIKTWKPIAQQFDQDNQSRPQTSPTADGNDEGARDETPTDDRAPPSEGEYERE